MAQFFQAKKKQPTSNKHQAITVMKRDHQGNGIGYLAGRPVFIEGALENESVLVQLTEQKSRYARAKLIKVLTPSAERIDPFCPHYDQCGGCQWQHETRARQVEHKQHTLKQRMYKWLEPELSLAPPVLGLEQAYRRRARLALKWDPKQRQLAMGFRQKSSQRLVDLRHCPVLDEQLNSLLPDIYRLLMSLQQPEQLGHLELVRGDNTVAILLRHLAPFSAQEQQKLRDFAQQHQVSLYLMPNSEDVKLLQGITPYYQETGVKLAFQPQHFIQVNQTVNQQMIEQALAWLEITPQDRILDLFCGLGNFSLPLAKRAQYVVGIEGVDEMVWQAKKNADLNQITNVDFYQADLSQPMINAAWSQQKFDKIVLDPARAGAAGIVEQCHQLGAKQVLYVACDAATLARDAQALYQQGYRLTRLGMLDMFPHTSHLESMALFVHADS